VNRTLGTYASAVYHANTAINREALAAAMLGVDIVALPFRDALYVLRGADVIVYPHDPYAALLTVERADMGRGRLELARIRASEDAEMEEQARAEALMAVLDSIVIRPDGTTPQVADAASYTVPAEPLTPEIIWPMLGPGPMPKGGE
jgi:hypothetical protein